MKASLDISTTGGEWIVKVETNNHLVIVPAHDENNILAIIPPLRDGSPNWADASLMASSKAELNALIEIYEKVNGSKDTFSIDEINEPISRAVEKIRAEADV